MRQRFDRGLIAGILLLAAMMVGIATTSYRNTRQVWDDADRIDHSRQVIDAVGMVQIDTRRTQADQRAYLITGFDDRIKVYEASADRLRASAVRLDVLTRPDPDQHQRARFVEREIESGITGLNEVVKLRGGAGGHAAVVAIAQERGGRSFVDPLLETLADMERVERERLVVGEEAARVAYQRALFYCLIAAGLGLTAVGMFVAMLARSIRARDRDAERLTEQRELLAATLVSIGDGVIATDASGNVTFLNSVAEKLTGWTSADAVGIPLDQVFHIVNESTRSPVDNPAFRALKEGVIVGLANHTVLIARDGTERPIDDSAAPIRDVAGAVAGAVLVFRDISERKQAEHLQAQLAAIVTTSEDAILSRSLDGIILSWNAGAERLFSYTSAEALGRPITLIVPPDRWDEERAILDRLCRGERIDHFETVRVDKGGRRVDVSLTISPLRDAEGRIAGASKVVRDVSERRRRDAERARLTETLRLAMDAGDLGTWEWDPATDAMSLSERAGVIYGVDSTQPHLRERLRTLLHPEHQNRARDAAAHAAVDRSDYDIEYPLVSGRWVAARGRGVYGPGGGPIRMIGVVQDVTARKQAEAALRASEERYRALVTATSDVVYRMSGDWDVMHPLDGRGLVPSTAEPLRGWMEINLPGLEHARVREAIRRAVESKQTFELEHQVNRADGSRGWTFSRAVPILDAAGGILEWFGTARDVTERKEAEEALRDADRKKDDFLALLAHELRNPLAPIRNGLQVIRLSQDRAVRERSQEMMDRQLGHMVRLIDDLLDVSRINRNKMALRRSRVSLAEAVNSAVETARPVIESAAHELVIHLPVETVFLDADLTRLAQVFSNLLTNSAKYTGMGGQIRLAAHRDENEVVVSVRDSGIGIPAEALPRIFDMFSQVDRSVERSTGGLGIGLALVKGLVEMHGGTVSATSEGDGRGSEFTVRLPVAHEQVTAGEPQLDQPPDRAGTKRRILVVDDNRDGAESLAVMLELLGNEVATAHDGFEAVEQAERFRPRVVLMDIGMPRLNGLEATRRIRQHPWGRDIAIIALTGWGQESDRERSKAAGCESHLVKPVNLNDLKKMMEELIETGGDSVS